MREPKRNDPPETLLHQMHQAGEAVLFCHVAPDGDTLGSARALELLLNQLGWRTSLAVDGELPARLGFLPGLTLCRPEEVGMPENAVAIAVDVSSPDRLGKAEAQYNAAARRWVIDHHGTNPGFGHINWVEGSAPATAILVNRLYRALGVPLSREAAICLYTALSTDTGNFVYDSVNDECFEMMAGLMKAGLPLAEISRVLFREKRADFVRLLGVTLPSLRVTDEGRVAGLCTSLEQFRQNGLNPAETEGVVDYAIDIRGVRMAYYLHEQEENVVKGSFRALPPYRVDQAARRFGGGGHPQAAGFTLRMSMAQAVKEAEAALHQALEEQNIHE